MTHFESIFSRHLLGPMRVSQRWTFPDVQSAASKPNCNGYAFRYCKRVLRFRPKPVRMCGQLRDSTSTTATNRYTLNHQLYSTSWSLCTYHHKPVLHAWRTRWQRPNTACFRYVRKDQFVVSNRDRMQSKLATAVYLAQCLCTK